MGVTRFPNGIEVGDSTTAGTFSIGGTTVYPVSYGSATGAKAAAGTVVVPSGASGTAFATGLTTVTYFLATPYGNVTAAGYAGVMGTVNGGSITLLGVSGPGTASTASGTAAWLALGT